MRRKTGWRLIVLLDFIAPDLFHDVGDTLAEGVLYYAAEKN